jgi:hypothetical protein
VLKRVLPRQLSWLLAAGFFAVPNQRTQAETVPSRMRESREKPPVARGSVLPFAQTIELAVELT